MSGKAWSPGEKMKDHLPTLKLDKLFILVSIMTDWPVDTSNRTENWNQPHFPGADVVNYF